MTDNRYIAFISYRHMKLDTAVAKKDCIDCWNITAYR